MGSALVGMARHGGVLPAGGTFFVFLDYMRPPVRLAAISASQGALRVHPRLGRRRRGRADAPAGRAAGHPAGDPGLQVIRPADANETVAALVATVGARRADGARAEPPVDHAVTDGSAVDPRRGGRASTATSPTWCSSPRAARSRCAWRPPRRWTPTAWRRGVVSLPSWDRFAPVRRLPGLGAAAGVPVLSVEAAITFGWAR